MTGGATIPPTRSAARRDISVAMIQSVPSGRW